MLYLIEKNNKIVNLTSGDVDDYYTYCLKFGNKNTGLGVRVNTIVKHRAILIMTWDHVSLNTKVKSNIVKQVKLSRNNNELEGDFHELKEANKLINCVKTD